MKQNFLSNLIAMMIVAAVFLTGLLLVSCKKDVTQTLSNSNVLKVTCPTTEAILWAGQNIDAGTLYVWDDGDNLYIDYVITDPAQAMTEIHLWAGKDIFECPHTTPGNPKVGQFPYFANATSSVPTGNLLTDPMHYSLTVPFTDVQGSPECSDVIYIAAHAKAAVETLWGAGVPFPGNSWATYTPYTITCCITSQK
jgi:hypothetical protein